MDLITTGITQNSPLTVQQGLDRLLARRSSSSSSGARGPTPAALRDRVLGLAVKRARADVVRYLVEEVGWGVEGVRAGWVGGAVRGLEAAGGVEGKDGGEEGDVIGVLEVLVERGWDVNGRGETSPDPRYPEYLIYQVCGSERLVRWCLDHGAHVAYPDVEPYTPLLDYVAQSSSSSGNTAIFKLLIDRGAKLGRRTLHLAARSSAAAAGGGRPEILQRNMEVVRFLVEEMGCDVNGMDVPEGKQYGNHYGTPLNYIAHGSGGGGEEMIVRYLLEKGANPEIKDCWDICDAFGYAESGNKKVLEILNQWKQQNENAKS